MRCIRTMAPARISSGPEAYHDEPHGQLNFGRPIACIDFEESFAPVARIEAIRIFIANAANKEYDHLSDGCQNCFSECALQERSLVHQPKDLKTKSNPTHVYRRKKALMAKACTKGVE
ncbi:retrovirus-related pol polyprotein from transposon TNT 1-94 [Tanacetum coccineum]